MLTTFFADIEDFRRRQGQKYELHNILLLSVIAFLCNAKSYRDINRFIKVNFTEIKRELSDPGTDKELTTDCNACTGWSAPDYAGFITCEIATSVDINSVFILRSVPLNGAIMSQFIDTSGDGITWVQVVNISGNYFYKTTAKNSARNEYSFENAQQTGTSYYRLKMINTSEKEDYSKIVSIKFGQKSGIKIMPNPASDIITLTGTNDLHSVELINSQGQTLRKTSTVEKQKIQLNVSQLPSGMYILKLVSDEATRYEKIIIKH